MTDEQTRADLTEIKSDVKAIFRILHGNGTGGIVTRINLLEQSQEHTVCELRKVRSRAWDTGKVFLAAALAVTGAVVVNILMKG